MEIVAETKNKLNRGNIPATLASRSPNLKMQLYTYKNRWPSPGIRQFLHSVTKRYSKLAWAKFLQRIFILFHIRAERNEFLLIYCRAISFPADMKIRINEFAIPARFTSLDLTAKIVRKPKSETHNCYARHLLISFSSMYFHFPLSVIERQWIQVSFTKSNDDKIHLAQHLHAHNRRIKVGILIHW